VPAKRKIHLIRGSSILQLCREREMYHRASQDPLQMAYMSFKSKSPLGCSQDSSVPLVSTQNRSFVPRHIHLGSPNVKQATHL